MKMLSVPTRDQVIALAGVFQACQLVDDLARQGSVSSQAFAVTIHSIFEQNPASTEAVFGGIDGLTTGIDSMRQLLSKPGAMKRSTRLRYFMSLLLLQRKLAKNKSMLARLGTGIEQAARQAEIFGETHDNVLANLADLYQNTISTFSYRIQVSGQAQHLQQARNANRIRCLLLGGIRAAMLWQQVGGNRLHLAFRRQQMLNHLQQLRTEL